MVVKLGSAEPQGSTERPSRATPGCWIKNEREGAQCGGLQGPEDRDHQP